MHVTAVCPSCQNRYQLDPSLRGQRIRCPNPLCREVFEVQDTADAAPEPAQAPSPRPSSDPVAPPQTVRVQGAVGDVVPILTAERAGPAPPGPLSHHELPPVRAPQAREQPKPAQRPKPPAPAAPRLEPPPAPAASTPLVLPPGSWDAPPVRRPSDEADSPTPLPPAPAPVPDAPRVVQARRRARWLMGGIVLAALAVLAVAGWLTWRAVLQSEGRLYEQAQQEYQEGHYAAAADRYRELAQKFPESGRAAEYRFFADLSELRAEVYVGRIDARAGLDKADDFFQARRDDLLLKEHGRDLGQTVVKLVGDWAEATGGNVTPETMQLLDRANRLLADLGQALPDAVKGDERRRLDERFAAIRQEHADNEQRQRLVDRLDRLARSGSHEALKEARALIKEEARTQPGLESNDQVREKLDQVYQARFRQVRYEPGDPDSLAALAGAPDVGLPGLLSFAALCWGLEAGPAEDTEASLVVVPWLEGQASAPGGPDRVVPALVRGVLYGLAEANGTVRWVQRLGVDTQTPPVRVPGDGARPEMFLAVSADTQSLLGLEARTGAVLWRRPLRAPAPGRPVVVESRAFVPTSDGRVHEVELTQGRLLGRYHLGQRLTLGGARQENTNLVYFPADDSCVFVLDVGQKRCHAMLFTEHPAGSLRGEPVVVTWGAAEPNAPGLLVLLQTHGLRATVLRSFDLPLPAGVVRPPARASEPRLRGWAWFAPAGDGEKLVAVTDEGVLGLFGIPQPNNQDEALFPLLRDETRLPAGAAGRSQVVLTRGNDVWVLAQGGLHHLEITWDRAAGPKIVPAWPQPLPLGPPVHAAHSDEGSSLLFLVTQSAAGQVCRATAVEAGTGRVRWQRQLGLVCQDDPVVLDQAPGSPVVALDQGGGLFLFDPARPQAAARPLAPPSRDAPAGPAYLLAGGDGASAYAVGCVVKDDGARELVVRGYQAPPEGERAEPWAASFRVAAPLAGRPAVGAHYLLIPLADGTLWRLPRDGKGKPEEGPGWRVKQGTAQHRAHVAWLGDDEFVTTNGERGLTRWRWPKDDAFRAVPDNRDAQRPTVELPARVASRPAVLPAIGEKDGPFVCVADAEGSVWLLTGPNLERRLRRWQVGGTVTAGPFVRDGKVGCVVDRRRLVWLDPSQDAIAWQSPRPDGTDEPRYEGIVGEPRLVEGLLVVADRSGRYELLGPADGRRRGGYAVQASAVPAACPVAFGPGRAFAALSDGTVLLLPVKP